MQHLLPRQAWDWLQSRSERPAEQRPLFVDVRMEVESLYVGRPPGVVQVPWYEYPELRPEPLRFVQQVEREAGSKERPLLLICRSGKRTLDAGAALEAAGFSEVAHVLHGFEGDLDAHFHRSTRNGWRFDGLPWEQM